MSTTENTNICIFIRHFPAFRSPSHFFTSPCAPSTLVYLLVDRCRVIHEYSAQKQWARHYRRAFDPCFKRGGCLWRCQWDAPWLTVGLLQRPVCSRADAELHRSRRWQPPAFAPTPQISGEYIIRVNMAGFICVCKWNSSIFVHCNIWRQCQQCTNKHKAWQADGIKHNSQTNVT